MHKLLPPNDLGAFTLVENCQRMRIQDVFKSSYKTWKENLGKTGLIKIDGINIKFSQSTMAHGGTRLWFTCPACKRRCSVIHQHPVTEQIGCRICLKLSYKKQRYKGMIESI